MNFSTICLQIIAGLGAAHFLISLLYWGKWYSLARQCGESEQFVATYFLTGFLPAVLLFVAFSIGLWCTWAHRKTAEWLLGVGVLLAVACFWYETSFGEPQWQRIWFEENRACSSRENHYCTWWWWSDQIR